MSADDVSRYNPLFICLSIYAMVDVGNGTGTGCCRTKWIIGTGVVNSTKDRGNSIWNLFQFTAVHFFNFLILVLKVLLDDFQRRSFCTDEITPWEFFTDICCIQEFVSDNKLISCFPLE